MMKATGSESALELSLDGKPVVVLDHAKLGFSFDGQVYTVRRSGLLGPLYELQQDGLTLLSTKQAAFANRYTVSLGDRVWMLKAVDHRHALWPVRRWHPGGRHLPRRPKSPHKRHPHRSARGAAVGRASVFDVAVAVEMECGV